MEVRETSLLGGLDGSLIPLLKRRVLKHLVDFDNVLQLVQEPSVDLGQVMQLFNTVVEVEHSVGNGKQTPVVILGQGSVHVLGFPVRVETEEVGVDLSNSLLQGFLERTTDGHDFTNRFHGGSDVSLDVLELGQIPFRDLCDDVVKGWLETSSGGLGDGVRQFGESVAKSNLSSGVSKGVSSGLRGKGATS